MATDIRSQETARTASILESKIKAILKAEGKEENSEEMWKGALSVFQAALSTDGEYTEEGIALMNKYAPESLGGHSNQVREVLKKYASLSQSKPWENKDFYGLMLKTFFTEEAFSDQDCVEKVLELSTSPSPKGRKKALPALRRVIEFEDAQTGESKTFNRLVQMLEALCRTNSEYSGKIISVLTALQQEIVKYGMSTRMLEVAQAIQSRAESASLSAVTFARTLLGCDAKHSLAIHLSILEEALRKEMDTEETFVLLMNYAADIFKRSNLREVQGLEPFVVAQEGTSLEIALKEAIKAEMERSKPEKLSLNACLAIHALLGALNAKIFPYFKKLVVMVAYYCFTEKDMRISKEVELIIGFIGVERFLKTIKEKEFLFWLPMIKGGVHSTDIEVFQRRFFPEIDRLKKNEDRVTEYEALWACFPSFCRGMKDPSKKLRVILDMCTNYISNPVVRGSICQGIHVLVEDSQRSLSFEPTPEMFQEKMAILKTVGESVELFEKIAFRFKKTPAETERQCIRSMLSVLDEEWKNNYFREILAKSFTEAGELHTGELKPEYARKENDVPENERVFIENAHLLEIVAPALVGNSGVEQGVLKFCVSTHLRTQKMGYKVALGLVESGYAPSTLLDFFMHPTAEQVLFPCTRHIRLQVLYQLLKRHGRNEGTLLCRLVYELVKTVRIDGGKNRKAAFDITEEMAASYSTEMFGEVCKMVVAGVPKGLSEYQAGAITIVTTLIYNGKEKVTEEVLDVVFASLEDLSAEKKYATSKALVGFLSVLLINTPYIDRYLERSLVCLDRIMYHFKMKLHENLKLILRKILEKRDIPERLSYAQKELLKHRPQNRTEEKERIITGADGKIHVKSQEIIRQKENSNARKRVKR
ncbi:hypothetical protein NEDG_00262 [Nematocida displodere]|uniref:RRP12 HEAT domain-containing protein n=1 Tax=Nematocida displodere TaxID=1805483 RepID=A0A177EIM6_9MICR|nr:hypothetical protein NEDG_00262 [Nematocida displodere]